MSDDLWLATIGNDGGAKLIPKVNSFKNSLPSSLRFTACYTGWQKMAQNVIKTFEKVYFALQCTFFFRGFLEMMTKRNASKRQENIKVIKHVLKYRLSIGLLGSLGLNLQPSPSFGATGWGNLFMGSCLQIWKWTGKKRVNDYSKRAQRKVESIWLGQMFGFGCFKSEKESFRWCVEQFCL